MKTKQTNPVGMAIPTEPTIGKATVDDSKTQERQQPKKAPEKKPSSKCSHNFGYLSNLPKKSKPPRECLQCRRMTGCASRRKPRKTPAKHTEAILAMDEEREVYKQSHARLT